jgi:hypothetical protein
MRANHGCGEAGHLSEACVSAVESREFSVNRRSPAAAIRAAVMLGGISALWPGSSRGTSDLLAPRHSAASAVNLSVPAAAAAAAAAVAAASPSLVVAAPPMLVHAASAWRPVGSPHRSCAALLLAPVVLPFAEGGTWPVTESTVSPPSLPLAEPEGGAFGVLLAGPAMLSASPAAEGQPPQPLVSPSPPCVTRARASPQPRSLPFAPFAPL